LHVSNGQWRLAPAFDVNPFPDKERESKTWLSEQDGPIVDVATLLARCAYFALTTAQARVVLAEVARAVAQWKALALGSEVGLRATDLEDFAPAFDSLQLERALVMA
jgi:serine/threonine-protein kinase HipA